MFEKKRKSVCFSAAESYRGDDLIYTLKVEAEVKLIWCRPRCHVFISYALCMYGCMYVYMYDDVYMRMS